MRFHVSESSDHSYEPSDSDAAKALWAEKSKVNLKYMPVLELIAALSRM